MYKYLLHHKRGSFETLQVPEQVSKQLSCFPIWNKEQGRWYLLCIDIKHGFCSMLSRVKSWSLGSLGPADCSLTFSWVSVKLLLCHNSLGTALWSLNECFIVNSPCMSRSSNKCHRNAKCCYKGKDLSCCTGRKCPLGGLTHCMKNRVTNYSKGQ